MLPYGRQSISDVDIESVSRALQSDWLTTGPLVDEFERRFAERIGARHAIAVNNGTSALHLAMLAAGVGPGHRVVTSPNTFLASANCAAFVGATPDFSDVEPVTWNLCPETLDRQWKDDTRAVVAVDYAGQTADLPAIADVARRRGAVVIEDACHAVGGRFEAAGSVWNIGGHPWADMTTFSFHPVKTMTTGEGGMVVTDDEKLATRARVLRTHGMLRDPGQFAGLGDPALDERGPWYYEMQELGYNFRLTDFQCALGLSQLARLDEFIARRQQIVRVYNEAFAACEGICVPELRNPNDRDLTSWHLYTVLIDFDQIGVTRTDFMQTLRERGVGTQVLYIPVHLQPWYRRTYGYASGKCPVAEDYYRRTLSLPLYPAMTDAEVHQVIQEVLKVVDRES